MIRPSCLPYIFGMRCAARPVRWPVAGKTHFSGDRGSHRPAYWTRGAVLRYSSSMNSEDIMRRIELLRQEHRDFDSAISALAQSGSADQLQLARLKKRKLMLRDEIAMLEDLLIPDIIA